jgi:hypothetical protein
LYIRHVGRVNFYFFIGLPPRLYTAVVGQPLTMKTRLTNRYLDFVKHVESELSKPCSTDTRVVFSVFPAFGSGHFSVQIVEEANSFVLVRRWNQDLGDSYQLGIYNLGNVKIEEEKLSLSDKDLATIIDLVMGDIQIEDLKAIILDGVDYELKINSGGKTEVHCWRMEEQISGRTKELVRKLVDVAGLQQRK